MNAIHSAISATPATGAFRAATASITSMALAGVLAVPLTAFAAGTDELWEMTMQMSGPGMPAGMGAHTMQQCQGKEWRSPPGAENCTVSDLKQTATRVTYKTTCASNPPVTASIDITFEQNRSRLKGTMRAATPQGEMLTRISGRRIGTCDAAQVRREQQAAVESSRDMQRQHQDLQRQQREIQLNMDAAQAAETQKCTDALSTMDAGGFGTGAYCHTRTDDETCRELSASDTPTGATHRACSAKFAEFCRQFQTQAGFEKTKHGKDASELCGVSIEPLRAKFCPGALKTESIAVLDEHCPAEKKMLAQRRCHGPDYSWSNFQEHLGRHKYYNLCTAHCNDVDCDPPRKARPAAQTSERKQPPAAPDTSGEAINQGIKKLKGLFGR